MRFKQMLTLVEAHAEGEVGRVITGGAPRVPGDTMVAKMDYLNNVDDSLRRFCVFEPRGCAQMSVNLLCEPTRDDADAGFIVLQSDRAHAMSGSNAICVATVLLETGVVPMREPHSIVRLDTAAGLVTARAECDNGKCVRVALDMPPAFVEQTDLQVTIDGVAVRVDIAFGGVYYALIDARQFELCIAPQNARRLVELGCAVHRAVAQSATFAHPEIASLNALAYVMFTDQTEDGELIGATILPPGRVDRSPCGTGNAARLALRAARGLAHIGECITARSITGGRFDVEYLSRATVGDREAVQARLSGRGWIYGMHHIGVDPDDPYPLGFSLADCWGDAFDLLK